ncbi:hypothetical protein [Acidimangrovimonas sediminis]|uniref:hypothetical protein n=1 Tax=Acidimangrovimonas sediminis TaxID=2056283 RepID=UPI000C80A324|nr:hypothetical protein [Acidimangrovimonas sediminis]
MRYKLQIMASAACLALAACGGSSSTPSSTASGAASASASGSTSASSSGSSLSAADAQTVVASYDDNQARIDSGALTTTSPTGQADMSGYVGVTDNAGTMAVGDLNMSVDFDGGKVTGTASNFGLYDDTDAMTKQGDASGSLGVTGTVSGSSMTAKASGTLSDGSTPADVSLGMNGKFYDDNGTLLVQGTASGTVTNSDGTSALDGGFFATKN